MTTTLTIEHTCAADSSTARVECGSKKDATMSIKLHPRSLLSAYNGEDMQITENTDKGEVLALCMSIAKVELEKCSTAGK